MLHTHDHTFSVCMTDFKDIFALKILSVKTYTNIKLNLALGCNLKVSHTHTHTHKEKKWRKTASSQINHDDNIDHRPMEGPSL